MTTLKGPDCAKRSEHHLWIFQSLPQKTTVSSESSVTGLSLRLAWKMRTMQKCFINRDRVTSLSSSACSFTGNIFPDHARGNSTLAYPRIFKVGVKMHMNCLCKRWRTLVLDSSFSSDPEEKRIFPFTLFPLILGQRFSFERKGPQIRVPHIE